MRRRKFLTHLSSAVLAAILPSSRRILANPGPTTPFSPGPPLGFEEIPHGIDGTHHVPKSYHAQVLLRWGDPLSGDAPHWHPGADDASAQARQFGYNNDFIAYLPLTTAENASTRGLLCVNHEYTSTHFMWPDAVGDGLAASMTAARTAYEFAAIGHSVVEIARGAEGWRVETASPYNRRITMDTLVAISGPAAGHRRLQTTEHAQGDSTRGVLAACGGGKTPWGTVLIGEENFHFHFTGHGSDPNERRNHERYGVGAEAWYPWWAAHHPHFDLAREPRAANGYGWVVEIDPYDPRAKPIKRTALGRFKHEAASCVLNPDGRVVVYLGDDEKFEYVYKFVTRDRYRPADRGFNLSLLDNGTLYVARFADNGELLWLPLVYGRGPLIAKHGFNDQAEVLIEARRAADLLGATRMDRPEDVETNPLTGLVYVLLSNNAARTRAETDAANPRAQNVYGHILELTPPGGSGAAAEHAATEFTWRVLLRAGDPENPAHHAAYPAPPSRNGWFAAPDNCAFDPQGRFWIATDQGAGWKTTGCADGLWACGLEGPEAGVTRCFFRAPLGAEVCGPEFTPDGKTLFVAIQHPGIDGVENGSFDNPGTRWPDFQDGVPPRPSVLAITREDGGLIGT